MLLALNNGYQLKKEKKKCFYLFVVERIYKLNQNKHWFLVE